jgi:hypothetical protein
MTTASQQNVLEENTTQAYTLQSTAVLHYILNSTMALVGCGRETGDYKRMIKHLFTELQKYYLEVYNKGFNF